MKHTLLTFLSFATSVVGIGDSASFDSSLPCLVQPVSRMQSGDELLFQYVFWSFSDIFLILDRLFGSYNSTCEATMIFESSNFLPISALAIPRNCSGQQMARMKIPTDIPSGLAAIQWLVNSLVRTSSTLTNHLGNVCPRMQPLVYWLALQINAGLTLKLEVRSLRWMFFAKVSVLQIKRCFSLQEFSNSVFAYFDVCFLRIPILLIVTIYL